MTPERWQQVAQVFQSAIEQEPGTQEAYLTRVCGDDAELRREVESLLAQPSTPGLIDRPLVDVTAHAVAVATKLAPGTMVGPYRVVDLIGEGGMGQVYRATDTNLGRQVAIKVLPAAFVEDRERVARFEREAKTLAALNDPHIAQIYGLERSATTPALVMEFVEGETLADRIARGPIPIDEALPIAKQIAEALEAAHEQGIIHRDLKPANVKVRPDGTVKVLDFGLAKLAESSPTSSLNLNALSISPTITSPALMTGVGVLLGTAAYMSPEQARGRAVDRRADIWAFGCVLYEMLCAAPAFRGETVTDVLASVVKVDPCWADLPSDTPPAIRTLIARCLEKDSRQRLQAIGEARIAIEKYLAAPGEEQLTQSLRPRHRWLWPTVAAVSLLAALGVLGWTYLRPSSPPEVTRFEIHAPEGGKLPLGTPAVSPDGRTLAYMVTGPDRITRIHVRSLDSVQSRALPGTENAIHPFWSGDGRSLAFAARGAAVQKLYRIDLAGGGVRPLTDVTGPWHGTWNGDRTILFTSQISIHQISADGGPATLAAAPDEKGGELGVGFPSFLSDGKRFLMRVVFEDGRGSIELATLGSSERKTVVAESRSAPILARTPGGKTYLMYLRESDLWAQEFDERAGSVQGNGVILVNNIGRVANPDDLPTVGVSSSGILAYQTDTGASGQLAWFDRSGKLLSELPSAATGESPTLSPDGQLAAVEKRTATSTNIWVTDLVRGSGTPLTFSNESALAPSWSPDGKIAYQGPSSKPGIYEIDANGNGQERLLTPMRGGSPLSWSPDGKYLLYRRLTGSRPGCFLLPLTGDKESIPVGSANGVCTSGTISPDGRYIAFSSNESGRFEVYVQPMPPGAGKKPISINGGSWPKWRRDGKELFFLSPDLKMMAADVNPNMTVVGIPHELFATPISSVSVRVGAAYDVSADGQKFLLYFTGKESDAPITVVLNWWVGLKKN